MKILFAIKNMNNAKGGAERVLSFVVNGLIDKGHEITLLTFDERGLDTFYKIDKNIKRVSLGIGCSEKKASLRETLARIQALRRIVNVRKPDIVVPFMHSMFIPMAFALLGIKIPIIASEHIVPRHYKKRQFEYILLMISSFFVKKITVLSESVKNLYPAFIRRKMVVMPNPVYVPPEEEGGRLVSSDRKVILNVGRLSEQKNQKTLVRAFAELADKYPDWDIRIVGEGEDQKFLEDLIEKHHLKDRVFLIGTTSQIVREYKKAYIFAMPSKYESFGLATAEAMFFGIPAVGFAECPGTNEIVTHGQNGLLAKRDKSYIHNYAQELEKLMIDKTLRETLGEQAKKDITKYNPSVVIDNWEKLIKSVVV